MGKQNHVLVACAICGTEWTVKPSRAKQNNAITCSKACLSQLRSRNRVKHFGTEQARRATCPVCQREFERKPSQLAKYGANYCSRACRAVGIRGPRLDQRTGEWLPCKGCGEPAWRTPATKQPHTYCSAQCANNVPRKARVARVTKQCAHCQCEMILLPAEATRYRFCSLRCAARSIQGAKRGLRGRRWTSQQRRTLSVTLMRKYKAEWAYKGDAHSLVMTGPGNPQWQDGRSLEGYAPGFTMALKRRIALRDGNRCRVCGSPRRRGTHAVHHIDGEKTDHSESNLILLCARCHGLVHAGRIALPLAADA